MINYDAKIISYYVHLDEMRCWYVRNPAQD